MNSDTLTKDVLNPGTKVALDPQTADLLRQFELPDGADPVPQPDIETAREGARTMWLSLAGERVGNCQVKDVDVAIEGTTEGTTIEIPVRIYHPEKYKRNTLLPVVVFLHGGGWCMGDLDCYDDLIRSLCYLSGCIYISVDYRLAPEHKYPAGLDDGMAITLWAQRQAHSFGGDSARLAIMGDSAGGNLATVIARRLHDNGSVKIAAQILIYPVLDVSPTQHAYPSRIQFGDGDFLLSRDSIDTTVQWYLGDKGSVNDADISPLLAPDLSGLPPTIILTAGCDPLCDEAQRYTQRLQAAGVSSEYICYENTIHAFLSFGVLNLAQQARSQLASKIRQLLDFPNL